MANNDTVTPVAPNNNTGTTTGVNQTGPAQLLKPAQPPVAPVQPAPAVTAQTETPEAPQVQAESVTVAPVAAPDTQPQASPDSPKEPVTLLGKDEVKPGEPEAKAPEALSPQEGQSDKAPPPAYEPFQLPEGVSLQPEKVTKFTELLTGLELEGKADHNAVQQFGQKAVDFYINEVQEAQKSYVEDLTKMWDKQRTDWKDSFLKDPEIGGNRWQTTVQAARDFISLYGGTDEQAAEVRALMESSGLGNHPAIIRMFYKANSAKQEGKPLAAKAPPPAPKSKTKTLYGAMSTGTQG